MPYDIPRPDLARKKKLRRTIYIAAALVTLPVVTIAVSRLKPAAPTVERSTVWVDIGLALSRQIAEAHGGSLVLENRKNTRGCRALLRLPL